MSEELTSKSKQESVLKIPAFRNLWVGQLISQFGDVMYGLVFLWLVLESTGQAWALGVVGACAAMPYVLFSLYAGTLADRLDRRKLLIASDIASAVLVFGFMILIWQVPKPPLEVICLVAFLLGTANVVAAPARSAITPRLVPPEKLQEAIGLNSTSQSAMPLVGSALSAIILEPLFRLGSFLAYILSFGLNGISFVVSAIYMWRLPSVVAEREDEKKSAWIEAKEGIGFLLKHPILLPAVLIAVGMNFFVAPFMPAYVYAAQVQYKSTPALLALFETGFFLGMVIGSLGAMKRNTTRPGIAFAIWLFLCALPIIPMGYVAYLPTEMWVKILTFWMLNLVCGVALPFGQIPLQTLIQLQTEDSYRGRVNSAMGMMAALVMPVGTALSGYLIEWLTLAGTFAFIGIGLALTSLIGLVIPSLRHARLRESTTEVAGDHIAITGTEGLQ